MTELEPAADPRSEVARKRIRRTLWQRVPWWESVARGGGEISNQMLSMTGRFGIIGEPLDARDRKEPR